MSKLLVGVLLVLALPLQAADLAAGGQKAQSCVACHGPKGCSTNPVWPNIANQKQQYLLKQLKDFSTGDRQDPLMEPQAKMLNEADMENLAAYFSQLPDCD